MSVNLDLEVDDETLMKSRTFAQNVYDNPGFILGSPNHIKRTVKGFDFQTNKIVSMDVTIPMVPEQIFLEFTANMIDEMGQLSEHMPLDKIPPIEVTMDRQRITIKNAWLPRKGNKELEIAYGKGSKKWVPERAFGAFFNSAHYDQKDNKSIGRNGIGVKGANLFSTSLFCHLSDAVHSKRQYIQQWQNNMSQVSEPLVVPITSNDSFVLISYVLQFSKFGMQQYPDEFYNLVAKHCHDMAMTTRVPVRVTMGFDRSAHQENCYPISSTDGNGTGLFTFMCEHPTRLSYAKLIGFDKEKEFEYTTITLKREGDSVDKPSLEFILMDTPSRAQVVSFANGVNTREHGQYISDLIDEVARLFIEVMKEKKAKDEEKRIKALMKMGELKRVNFPLDIRDVKNHLSYLISINGADVEFDSQIKIRLSGPEFPFKGKIDINEIKKLTNWKVFECLIDAYQAKNEKKAAKNSKGSISLKHIPANNAKKKIGAPALFLIEGDSAKNYTNVLFGILGRDNFGSLPLRGKVQNAMTADQFARDSNKEFNEIANAVGLKKDVDYRVDDNYRKLSYKYIITICDMDPDGKHITALCLNYLYVMYPTFIQRPGTVMIWKTPLKRVWKKSDPTNVITICSIAEEEDWKRKNPDWETWEQKYYKGLGTSTKTNIIEDAKRRQVVTCLYDDRAADSFKYAFHKDFSDTRKQWIEQWAPNLQVEEMTLQPISLFLYYIFGEYNCANLIRSIPSYMDGLKPGLRKAIHTAFHIWGNRIKGHSKDMVLMNFAAKAMDLTCYHHGDMSMRKTIIGMSQSFIGSNNLPFFGPHDGSFGTRMEGGKDASSARYLYTLPRDYLPYLFRPEDIPLLQYIIEQKIEVEPKFYLPVICPIYNGQSGIATGWATTVPNFNPRDIIAWHRAKIMGKPLPILKPYYHGFKGTIELVGDNHSISGPIKLDESDITSIMEVEKKNEELETNGIDPTTIRIEDGIVKIDDGPPEDMKEVDESVKNRFIIKGIFNVVNENTVHIEELPVGVCTMNYKNWLDTLVDPKKKVAKKKKAENKEENKEVLEPKLGSYTDQINDVDAVFDLYGLEFKPTHKSLKLIKNYGMDNMIMLNPAGKPVKFPNIVSLLETFHRERLPYYQLRKSSMLQKLADNVTGFYDKIKFIRAVLNKELVVEKRPKKEVHADMIKLGILPKLLNTGMDKLTDEEIKDLWNDAEKARLEYEELAKISPEALWLSDLADLERNLPF
jgi:DNA topoisomerase-2